MPISNINKKYLFCLDLDDTLIDDNFKFELTFCDCIKVIIEAFETRSPQIDEILDYARQLDNEKLITWPTEKAYSPQRLEQTWIETYEYFCQDSNVPVKEYIKQVLHGLVLKNFDPPYYIIPGAIEALDYLVDAGNVLHLVSTGTAKIQLRKITITGIKKFFKVIHLVPGLNKEHILEDLKKQHPELKLVMIGNSMRSDINPALSLGLDAIYIPRGSWHQFVAEPINNKYYTLNDISELPQFLSEKFQNN